MKEILYYSKNEDLKKLLEHVKDSDKIELKLVKEIKKLINKIKNSKVFISDDSLEGEILSLIFKILNKETILWINEYKKYPIHQKLTHVLSKNFSDEIITRSKQIKFLLNKNNKKNIHVVFPWIEEITYKKRKIENKIYINSKKNIKIPNNWTRVYSVKEADISLLEYNKNILKISMPKLIFKSAKLRIPTVIVNDNVKLVNKLFRAVKNIHAVRYKDIDFNYLEYLANKNYSFKIPKRYRFKYNLSVFKKIINK